MIVEDQSAVIAFLSDAANLGSADPVRRIETHGAIVFLTGDRAYKLKRAVHYPYMDFSTVDRRRAMCEAELRVNRRTAPEVYLDVAPVARSRDGTLRLGGDGEVLDWVVVMRRFDDSLLLDRLAEEGTLTRDHAIALAQAIARFHREAESVRDRSGAETVRRILDGFSESFPEVAEAFDAGAVDALLERLGNAAEACAAGLDRRGREDWIRRCHGDLHLHNACLIDGEPVLFDAIEFNDDLAVIDVLYDLGFLLMDLDHRGFGTLGNAVLNAWLPRVGGHDGLAALPLFLAMRATVRALVTATAAATAGNAGTTDPRREEARAYLRRAMSLLAGSQSSVTAIGGFSGTGKTTLAYALAPMLGRSPGAVVLRSDEIRKEIMGVDPLTRLEEDAYRPEVSARVYELLFDRAAIVAGTGQAVVVDAVFNRPEGRRAIDGVASAARLPFAGIWLEAPESRLVRRVEARRNDASDADARVVAKQLAEDPGPMTWHRIPADRPLAAVRDDAIRTLTKAGIGVTNT